MNSTTREYQVIEERHGEHYVTHEGKTRGSMRELEVARLLPNPVKGGKWRPKRMRGKAPGKKGG